MVRQLLRLRPRSKIGIATTAKRAFAHYGEAVAVATEMKQFAKRSAGSSFAVDRRAATP
jgi:sensor histidine kinase YesM